MFSEGEPEQHTLFVQGRTEPGPMGIEELLIVDPPAGVREQFVLPERSAAVFTGARLESGLAEVTRVAGGDAHLRFGQRLVDIYHHAGSTLVLLPEVGLLCSGSFGSDLQTPQVAPGSDGADELDALRMAAKLIRERTVQLMVPRCGTLASDRQTMMERLADDVAYLHGLRRAIKPFAEAGESLDSALDIAESLLPQGRRSTASRMIHAANVAAIMGC